MQISKQKPGDTFTFLVIVKPQPEEVTENWIGYPDLKDESGFTVLMAWDKIEDCCPHPVGSIVGIREAFGFGYPHKFAYPNDDGFRYKADLTDKKWKDDEIHCKCSPAIMPSEAIRSTYEITGVLVKRVKKVTPFDVFYMGLLHETPKDFHGYTDKDAINIFKNISTPNMLIPDLFARMVRL